MANICVRKHIRWPPAPATEPTSTLVLTSPARHFVDLRILLSSLADHQPTSAALPASSLDWAIAGTSTSWTRPGPNGEPVSHSRWTHWVDSRTAASPETTVVDEGDMHPQPDGTTLEQGRMVDPATGLEADYEELWADVAGSAERCLVLRLDDPARGARGMIVLLGRFCQGLVRVGGEIGAQRWERQEERVWTVVARIGDLDLPCDQVIQQDSSLSAGHELRHDGGVWKVEEAVP